MRRKRPRQERAGDRKRRTGHSSSAQADLIGALAHAPAEHHSALGRGVGQRVRHAAARQAHGLRRRAAGQPPRHVRREARRQLLVLRRVAPGEPQPAHCGWSATASTQEAKACVTIGAGGGHAASAKVAGRAKDCEEEEREGGARGARTRLAHVQEVGGAQLAGVLQHRPRQRLRAKHRRRLRSAALLCRASRRVLAGPSRFGGSWCGWPAHLFHVVRQGSVAAGQQPQHAGQLVRLEVLRPALQRATHCRRSGNARRGKVRRGKASGARRCRPTAGLAGERSAPRFDVRERPAAHVPYALGLARGRNAHRRRRARATTRQSPAGGRSLTTRRPAQPPPHVRAHTTAAQPGGAGERRHASPPAHKEHALTPCGWQPSLPALTGLLLPSRMTAPLPARTARTARTSSSE